LKRRKTRTTFCFLSNIRSRSRLVFEETPLLLHDAFYAVQFSSLLKRCYCRNNLFCSALKVFQSYSTGCGAPGLRSCTALFPLYTATKEKKQKSKRNNYSDHDGCGYVGCFSGTLYAPPQNITVFQVRPVYTVVHVVPYTED
jgi:hypothetical protein